MNPIVRVKGKPCTVAGELKDGTFLLIRQKDGRVFLAHPTHNPRDFVLASTKTGQAVAGDHGQPLYLTRQELTGQDTA